MEDGYGERELGNSVAKRRADISACGRSPGCSCATVPISAVANRAVPSMSVDKEHVNGRPMRRGPGTPDLSVVRFYLCANRACERAERAERAA
jgi:hypothetical protein